MTQRTVGGSAGPSVMRVLVAVLFTVLGTALLWVTFSSIHSSAVFILLALTLAAVWFAFAWMLTRNGQTAPSDSTRPRTGQALVRALLISVGTAAVFFAGTLLLINAPVIGPAVDTAARGAENAPLLVTVIVALITGLGEEAFFRGALPSLWRFPLGDGVATIAYTLSTLATGNPALILAAPLLAIACIWARRVTGRLWAAMMVHAVWSLVMIGGVPLLLV
ncbi:MAG: CPBP family intramembrane glutamic endopeptidase [Mycetocola sp.]